MADPDDQIQSGDDEDGGGKSGSKLPLIIVAFVVLLGAIGAIFYVFVLGGTGKDDAFAQTPRPTPGIMVPVAEAFTVNLPDGMSIATVKMTFEIKPYPEDTPEAEAEVEWMPVSDDNKHSLYPRIRSEVNMILGSKTRAELQSPAGQQKARQDIKNKLNQEVLSKSRIQSIYFTNNFVQ